MIRGTKTRLRALAHEDLPHLVRWSNDPETHHYATIRCPWRDEFRAGQKEKV